MGSKKNKVPDYDTPMLPEYATKYQTKKAEKALVKAKKLEQGKKAIRLNSKTIVIRKCS